jgi:hypothetical protein
VVSMVQTRTHVHHQPTVGSAAVETNQPKSLFWRHFFQMLGAMAVGMIVTGAIFLSVVGLKTWDEVTLEYPTQSLLAMAVGMTVPMAGWMAYRGMGRRNTYEMSAVMLVAVAPFLCLVWFGVTKSGQCGWYCLLTVVAMLALMRYRRAAYSLHHAQAQTAVADSTPGHFGPI